MYLALFDTMSSQEQLLCIVLAEKEFIDYIKWGMKIKETYLKALPPKKNPPQNYNMWIKCYVCLLSHIPLKSKFPEGSISFFC